MMDSRWLGSVLALTVAPVLAETVVPVADNPGYLQLDAKSEVQKLVASTVHQTVYPEQVGQPAFWLDCMQTNSWTFAANGGVSKIPSRVGTRYLTTSTEGGYCGYTWTAANPVLETASEGLGLPALDFGVKGSQRAMNFDPVPVAGGVSTNVLRDIGSVIAVWYSAAGSSSYGGLDGKGTGDWGEGGYYGGALLGGGFGTDGAATADKSGYVNYRAGGNDRAFATTDSGRPRWYDTALANSAHTHVNIRNGHVRHDGQSTAPQYVGFSAGWEIVSVVPSSAEDPLMNATGLGMNDSRIAAISGGFKVAEMLIFDKRLTSSETQLVEAYLANKWFGRRPRGYNGEAVLGRVRSYKNASGVTSKIEMPVETAAGERLNIGKLTGGRGPGSAVVKTGAGTLEIGDASAYGGTVEVREGTLSFANRTTPSALPHDAYIHFDASDSSSLITSEGAFVRFDNLTARAGWKMERICARSAGTPPAVLADAMGTGLHMLDFGDYVQNDFTRMLYLATNVTEAVVSVKAKPSGFSTVVAVIGAQRGGGNLIRQASNVGYFCRPSAIVMRFDSPALLGSYSIINNLTATNYATVMIDGAWASGEQGYAHPGYQVIAIRTPGNLDSEAIGGGAWGSGGLRLGEIAIYRRALSDEELRDASAYLIHKWLKRSAPGYAAADVSAMAKVTVSDAGAIEVQQGTSRVDELVATEGTFTKKGPGTLEYYSLDADRLTVNDGTLTRVARPDVASTSEIAAAPALHLDVTDAASLRGETVDGERRVYEWYSQGDYTTLATIPHRIDNNASRYGNYAHAPYLSSEVQLNGHDTLDFGSFGSGRALSLSRSFDSVRSAYIVWAPRDDSRGTYFGCSSGNGDTNGELYDFLRSSTEPAALVQDNATSAHVRNGEIRVNGEVVASTKVMSAGVFTLTEFHPTSPAHISALGTDRDIARLSGGIRVAEVVLYERELSEREKVATRNALMQKWFNAEPEELPTPTSEAQELYAYDVAGTNTLSGACALSVTKLTGTGTLHKEGAGTLTVADLSGFAGTLAIDAGTVCLTGTRPGLPAALAAPEARLFHVDARQGLTTVTNANGTIAVVKWESLLNDGWAAEPFYDAYKPNLIQAMDLDRNWVVDMGKSGDNKAMRFTKDGVTNLLEGIASAFWVIGSHNGGGYLLGGGHHYSNWNGGLFNFMRGGPGGRGTDPSYAILNSGWVCPGNLQNADWYLSGMKIKPTEQGLSGAWDLVGLNITEATHPTSNADGFAFDGRSLTEGSYQSYLGCQRLAEVILYNRKLTDEERRSTENYLTAKWCINGAQGAATNAAVVAVAAGATLDLGGKTQYVAQVTGAGTIANGTLTVGTLVADPLSATTPVLNVPLAFDAEQAIEVRHPEAASSHAPVRILSCTSLATPLSEVSLKFVGDTSWTARLGARLMYEDGALYLKFTSKAFTISFR